MNYFYHIVHLAERWAPKAITATCILFAFWLLAKICGRLIHTAALRLSMDEHVGKLLSRVASLAISLFGVVTTLGTLGVDVTALVAGLGLTGFALGFALKDIISNLLAGLLLLIYHPFRVGDSIRVAGFDGKVISIDLRYTGLQTGDELVLIPNANLFTSPIVLIEQVASG